jgi:hypothetical protein
MHHRFIDEVVHSAAKKVFWPLNSFWLLILISNLQSCDGARAPAQCPDPCPLIDYSMANFRNVDNADIFIKYANSSDGNIITNLTSMSGLNIPAGKPVSLPIKNDSFNHFYLFTDNSLSTELGKLIFLNTQPLYSSLCEIKLKNQSDFTAAESDLVISNARKSKICAKYALIPDWGFWNLFSPPGEVADLASCSTPTKLNSAPATLFRHLYFYESNCNPFDDKTNLSRVILLNTNSTKIYVPNIYLRSN